jgi:hypothetical protein
LTMAFVWRWQARRRVVTGSCVCKCLGGRPFAYPLLAASAFARARPSTLNAKDLVTPAHV